MSYAQLDLIADAYVPALGLVWLLGCILTGRARGWRAGAARLLLGVLALALVYGLAWVDARGALWARFGLDYSTHSAVAAALFAAIATAARWLRWALLLSLTGYCLLMLYQRYHTVADIASTLAILALPLWGLSAALQPRIAGGRNAVARADGPGTPGAGHTMSST